MFCHETQIPHENKTHKSHVCTQHSQDRDRSSQPATTATNTGVHGHVSVQEQGRLETQVGGGRPDGSQGCDPPTHEDDLGRSSTRTQSQELRGHLGVRDQGTPCCGPQEVSSVGLHERQGHGDQSQFGHCFASGAGGEGGDLQSARTPTGSEKMNFGKYADLTFEEVFNLHPSYVNWIATTAQESDSVHWRLLRFHRWATQMRSKQKIT